MTTLSPEDIELMRSISQIQDGVKFHFVPLVGYNPGYGFIFGASASLTNYGSQPSYYPSYKSRFDLGGNIMGDYGKALNALWQKPLHSSGLSLAAFFRYNSGNTGRFYGYSGDPFGYDYTKDGLGNGSRNCYERTMWTLGGQVTGRITKSWSWTGGLEFRSCDVTVPESGVLAEYAAAKLVSGGTDRMGLLKIGVTRDTRDRISDPTGGFKCDIYAFNVLSSGKYDLRAAGHARLYFSTPSKRTTFAAHFGLQVNAIGGIPCIHKQEICACTLEDNFGEGLGGQGTIRGIIPGRIVGNGYEWTNFELRFRIIDKKSSLGRILLAINPFLDSGSVIQPCNTAEIAAMRGISADDVEKMSRKIHSSFGAGIKFGLDSSVFSIEAAKAFKEEDGPFTIYCSCNYCF